uniref:Uncharacterized protein n=1 Tax=Arundo donax TaxID=35708 RepID=A0A0A9F928_ARUDO
MFSCSMDQPLTKHCMFQCKIEIHTKTFHSNIPPGSCSTLILMAI